MINELSSWLGQLLQINAYIIIIHDNFLLFYSCYIIKTGTLTITFKVTVCNQEAVVSNFACQCFERDIILLRTSRHINPILNQPWPQSCTCGANDQKPSLINWLYLQKVHHQLGKAVETGIMTDPYCEFPTDDRRWNFETSDIMNDQIFWNLLFFSKFTLLFKDRGHHDWKILLQSLKDAMYGTINLCFKDIWFEVAWSLVIGDQLSFVTANSEPSIFSWHAANLSWDWNSWQRFLKKLFHLLYHYHIKTKWSSTSTENWHRILGSKNSGQNVEICPSHLQNWLWVMVW